MKKMILEEKSALLCASNDGSHKQTSLFVGEFRTPRALKDIMHYLLIYIVTISINL